MYFFVSCQSCLLLVLTFPSWYKCFQIKTVRLLMGKVFSDGGIFVVFPRTISLFLLRWSFFGFISVFKPITNPFLLFSEKMGYVSASHWFHEKRFEILFFKTMFVLLGYPPMAQFALRVGNTNAVVLLFSTKTLSREIQKQLLGRNT